jgi:hypothetical protein
MNISRSKKLRFSLGILALWGLIAVPSAHASVTIMGLYDTGVNNAGAVTGSNLSSELHYKLTQEPAKSTTSLVLLTSGYPLYPGPYISNTATSAWIGPDNATDLNSPVGDYIYTDTFTISGLSAPTNFQLSGEWATDDQGLFIRLDNTTDNNPSAGFGAFKSFTVDSLLNNGANTLSFEVHNAFGNYDNPTALQVNDLFLTPLASPAPEPSQIGMLALMGLGLGGLMLRARRKATLSA